jgi:hypothetical protein
MNANSQRMSARLGKVRGAIVQQPDAILRDGSAVVRRSVKRGPPGRQMAEIRKALKPIDGK